MNRISAPISRILASIRWMTEYFVDLEKAIDVIETPKELDSGNHNFKEFNSSIEFQNVTFAYPESERVILENISLSIKK
jgi:ABC-type bacteriocin/lantibiotic exporter with double-glycine peptidase domain